jgi:hypothetical protein
VIDVQHRPLRAFEHHALLRADLLVDPDGAVHDARREDLAVLQILLVQLRGIVRVGVVHARQHGVALRARELDLLPQHLGIEQVGDADAVASHLRLVRRPDAASGRADLRHACRFLAREVERLVVRQDAVRAVADEEVLLDADAARAQVLDLVEQSLRVDDHAVPEKAELVGVDDAGRDEAQREVLVRELHGMAGVVAALIPRHDGEILAEKIDDLPLPLVSPLRADDGDVLFLFSHRGTARSLAQTARRASARNLLYISRCRRPRWTCRTSPQFPRRSTRPRPWSPSSSSTASAVCPRG